MTEEVLIMSRKELGRLEVTRRVVSKRLRQKEHQSQWAAFGVVPAGGRSQQQQRLLRARISGFYALGNHGADHGTE